MRLAGGHVFSLELTRAAPLIQASDRRTIQVLVAGAPRVPGETTRFTLLYENKKRAGPPCPEGCHRSSPPPPSSLSPFCFAGAVPPRLTHRNPASVLPPRVAFGWKGSHPLFPLKSSPCSAWVFTPLLGAERQPLSASAIGAALHFPSASALEARTPVFLPKPRSAERGVTLSFKVKPLPCSARVFTPLRRERPPLLASAIGAALLFLSTPVLAAWTTVSLHASQRWRHHLLYHPCADLSFFRLKISLCLRASWPLIGDLKPVRIKVFDTTHAFQRSPDELAPCIGEGRQYHLLHLPRLDLGFTG